MLQAQNIDLCNIEADYARRASSLTNGYAEKVSGDDITYNNLWDTQDQAFLTRTTTGKTSIVWRSEPAKKAPDGKVHFLMLSCVDQANEPLPFDFCIDGRQVGALVNFREASHSFALEEGVTVNFVRYARNEWADGGCFMEVIVPEKMVTMGKAVTFSLTGRNLSANNWMMIFKNEQLLQSLTQRARYDTCLVLRSAEGKLRIAAPLAMAGTGVSATINGHQTVMARFVRQGAEAVADFPGALSKGDSLRTLRVLSGRNEIIRIDTLSRYADRTELQGHTLVRWNRNANGDYVRSTTYCDAPEYEALIAKAPWRSADVHIIVSSHQDIAWMDTPYRCVEKRDDVIISPALALMEQHRDYCYNIEDALMVEEYLERNPQRRGEIGRLLADGQLSVGASYTQPYEEMQSSEALVRQLYYGRRYLEKQFGGYKALTYWNVDVPGRTLQMPQILAKSGVKGIQCSRHELGMYRWTSPDGSSVMVHTPGHYGVAAQFLRKTPEEGLGLFYAYLNKIEDVRSDKSAPPVLALLSSEDMSPAHTYYHWIDKLNLFAKKDGREMPHLRHATSDTFFRDLEKEKPDLPVLTGERPDIWMYIHGPAHERALTSSRLAARKALTAETFATIARLLDERANIYPQRRLDRMWKDLIYADHGWGGNGGHVTDSLFHARYNEADTLASEVSREAVHAIASLVRTDGKRGTAVIVFNPLSTVYSSPVKLVIDPRQYPADGLTVTDAAGKEVPYQLSDVTDSQASLEFIASDLPSVGYATYYLARRQSKKRSSEVKADESPYYKLSFDGGRLKQIADLSMNRDLFDTSKFDIGEVFSMQSVGNGAGEFTDIQKPDMEGFESTRGHGATWTLVGNGPVYSLYKSETEFADARVVRFIKLYKQIKRIDFPCSILNFSGRHYREFRQAFPMTGKGEVSYEVPFGAVTVGRDELKKPAGERYQTVPSTIHPRSVANWMSYSDGTSAVTLTSSVVVCDYLDPTDNATTNNVLQPILFASRRSCHWLGEFYEQRGDHHFCFSLRSDKAGDANGQLQARAANFEPYVVYAPSKCVDARLPERLSFFSTDNAQLVISAIKKHEDSGGTIIRLYNTQGDATSAHLQSFFNLSRPQHTDMLEYPDKELQGTMMDVAGFGIETFLVHCDEQR